jgi:cell division septation protein DedD
LKTKYVHLFFLIVFSVKCFAQVTEESEKEKNQAEKEALKDLKAELKGYLNDLDGYRTMKQSNESILQMNAAEISSLKQQLAAKTEVQVDKQCDAEKLNLQQQIEQLKALLVQKEQNKPLPTEEEKPREEPVKKQLTEQPEKVTAKKNTQNETITLLAAGTNLVICAAVAKETEAQNMANVLKAKGFKAGYLWIPDYEKEGKKLFRLFTGPYTSRKEAMENMAGIKQIYPTAYYYEIK